MLQDTGRPARRCFVCRDVELRFPGSTLRLFGETRNISASGMLLVAEDPKPRGTVIRFKLREFQGEAEVIWQRESEEGPLLGLRFLRLDPSGEKALRRLLQGAAPYH